MKTLALIIAVFFVLLMFLSVLTANSQWAGKMHDMLKKFFYKEGTGEV